MLFHFYNGHANASGAFQYVYLPKNMSNRQDLVQPWEMIRTLIWKPPSPADATANISMQGQGVTALRAPPPPGTHIYGPQRDERYWESCSYKGACEPDAIELDRSAVTVSPALHAVLATGKGVI